MVLLCLVVKLELVIGALPLNYNSVNYYENTTYADDSDIVPFLVDDASLIHLDDRPPPSSSPSRPSVIYQNEFAVFIPGGAAKADAVAEKHGFVNTGQVSKGISP